MKLYPHDYYFDFFQFKKQMNKGPIKKALPNFFERFQNYAETENACEIFNHFAESLENKTGQPYTGNDRLKIPGIDDPSSVNGNRENSLYKNAALYFLWQNRLSEIYRDLKNIHNEQREIPFVSPINYEISMQEIHSRVDNTLISLFGVNCTRNFREYLHTLNPTLVGALSGVVHDIEETIRAISGYKCSEYIDHQNHAYEEQRKKYEVQRILDSDAMTVGELRRLLEGKDDNLRVYVEIDSRGQYCEEVSLCQECLSVTSDDLTLTISSADPE